VPVRGGLAAPPYVKRIPFFRGRFDTAPLTEAGAVVQCVPKDIQDAIGRLRRDIARFWNDALSEVRVVGMPFYSVGTRDVGRWHFAAW